MLEFKTLKIDENQKTCVIGEEPIHLSKSEYLLLTFLLKNRNKIFSREELIESAWAKPVIVRAVDTAISRLRSKLKIYSKNIETRPGFGYGFIE